VHPAVTARVVRSIYNARAQGIQLVVRLPRKGWRKVMKSKRAKKAKELDKDEVDETDGNRMMTRG
jgi:hypothetical protein